jgi:hypothetical protein
MTEKPNTGELQGAQVLAEVRQSARDRIIVPRNARPKMIRAFFEGNPAEYGTAGAVFKNANKYALRGAYHGRLS